MYVAFGVTRHRLVQGMTVFSVVFAIVGGVLIALGFWIERAIFGAFGSNFRHLFDTAGSLTPAVFEYALILFAYFIGGWTISTGFYRFGKAGGLLFIIPALAPLAAVEASGWGSAYGAPLHELLSNPSFPTVTLATLGACGVGLLVNAWLLVTTPITNK